MLHSKSRHHHGHDRKHPGGGGEHGRRHARGDFWPGGEHGHGPRGERGPGRGGRLGRLFAHGDLHFVILHLIAEKPRHGYEIIKAVEEMAGGTYSPSPGTIYPALTMLEEQGYATAAAGEGNRKRYTVTDEGKSYLEANRAAVTALLTRVEQAGAARGDGPSPRIVRAVENLKLTLRLRLAHGPLSDEQIQTVAEALDRAAGAIERS
jgi:Predicted transcriptional regulators